MGEGIRPARVLARRGLLAMAVGAALVYVPMSAEADPPPAITNVQASISGNDAIITWDGGDPDALTVLEMRIGGFSPEYSELEGPTDAYWAPALDQRLVVDTTADPDVQSITVSAGLHAWPIKFLVRLKQIDPLTSAVTYGPVTGFAMPPGAETSTRFEMTAMTPLMSDDELEAAGLGFPQTQWGVTAEAGDPYRFFASSNGIWPHMARFDGDAADPVGSAPDQFTVEASQRLDDEDPPGPKYPWVTSTSVFYDATSDLHFLAYVTNRGSTAYNAIGLAASDDGGETFHDIDIVVNSPTEDSGTSNASAHNYVGTPSLVVKGDHAYLFFLQDFIHPTSVDVTIDGVDQPSLVEDINDVPGHDETYAHRPGVARASLADLRAAAAEEEDGAAWAGDAYTNPGDLFLKFSEDPGNDGFGEPGLGGVPAVIASGHEGQQTLSVIYSECTDEFILLTTTFDFTTMISTGLRSSGSSVMIGSSATGTDFDLASLHRDHAGDVIPYGELLHATALVSGESNPLVDTDGSFDLLAAVRPITHGIPGFDSQIDEFRLDRVTIEDSATCS